MYMCTNIYIYNHIYLRVEVPVYEGSAYNPGYKHTSTHTEVQLKARLTNFLQLEMQFLSFFLDV